MDFADLFLWADEGPEDGELGAFKVDESEFLASYWFFEENSALLVLQVDLQREWLMPVEHQRTEDVVLDL